MGLPRLRVLLLAGCVVVVGALMWWAARGGKQSVRLGDGRVVTLAKITYGKQHRYSAGTIWQKVLAPVLTTNLAKYFGVKTFKFVRDREAAFVWVEVADTNYSDLFVTTVDAEGHKTRPQSMVARAPINTNRWLYAFEAPSFPRGKEDFRLKIYERRKGAEALWAEFPVRDPAISDVAVWTAQPLPITNRVGEDSFVLVKFETGLNTRGHSARTWKNWTELEFQFGSKENAFGPWEPLRIELSNARGNVIREQKPLEQVMAGAIVRRPADLREGERYRGTISVPWTLWDEPWKVRVDFVRTQRSLFRPEEKWKVSGVPIPSAITTTETRVNLRTNVAGETVFFESLRVPSLELSPDRLSLNASVEVILEKPGKGALLDLVSAVDNRGSNVSIIGPPLGDSTKRFGLRWLSSEAKTVDLTFAVHRPCQVEFLAKPSLVQTNRFTALPSNY